MRILPLVSMFFISLTASANLNMEIPKIQDDESAIRLDRIYKTNARAKVIRENFDKQTLNLTIEEVKGKSYSCDVDTPILSYASAKYPQTQTTTLDKAMETNVGLVQSYDYSKAQDGSQICHAVYRRSSTQVNFILSEWSCSKDYYSQPGKALPALSIEGFFAVQYEVCHEITSADAK